MEKIEEMFFKFQKELEEEVILKEEMYAVTRSMDQAGRQIAMILQQIHQTVDEVEISAILKQCRDILAVSIGVGYGKLEEILSKCSKPQFYQYHDIWRNVTQKLTYLVALIVFMENGRCALYEDVAHGLNLKTDEEVGLRLDLEDYLIGLLSMTDELARLAVTSVTNGDNNRVLLISKVVGEMAAGFRLLTFKNDYLRKKYDALKYSVKKIEEVVYDLSIRGIVKKP